VGAEVAHLLDQIDPREFEALVEEFRDPGRRWFFSGQGRSGLVAAMVAMRFMHLGRIAHVQGEATAPSIRQGDGILLFSGSGETPITLHVAEIARREGARVVAVTHESQSTIVKEADTTLTLAARPSIQFGGSLFEQAALIVLDAVVYALADASPAVYQRMAHAHTNLQ
jgi:6-phospho-3-hexuloisomerase